MTEGNDASALEILTPLLADWQLERVSAFCLPREEPKRTAALVRRSVAILTSEESFVRVLEQERLDGK